MEQQVDVAQPQALPADVEAILQPISADHYQTPQAEPTAEPVVAQPVVAQPAPLPVVPPPPAEPHVPLHVLLEERKERQAYQRQIQQIIEAQQRASQPQQQPIDPVGDPEGFARAVVQENAALRQRMQDIATNIPAHITEHIVREKFGDVAVDEAVKAAHDAGLGNHFMGQKNPYKALMEWRNNQTIAQQIGPDLKAWETKKEQEIRARVLAEMQQSAAAARPAQPQFLPPSLSSATRASTASPVIQDASDFFKSTLFAKPQRT